MSDPKRILVIDDDPDIQSVCKDVLETGGYAVKVASSGAEGRKIAGEWKPDLVLVDVMMESADAGFETATWLASNLPAVPVVMLSSIADAADSVFDTSTLKLAALINKPIQPKELLELVARLLSRSR